MVDIGGEALRFQDMIGQAGAAMGLKRVILPVPVLSPRLSSYWLILFTPVPYKIASALVEGLKSETILQNDHAARYYPQVRPRNFREAVAAAELDLAHNQVVSRWCDSCALRACDIRDYDDPAGAVLRDVRVVPFARGERQQDVFRSACRRGGKFGWSRYTFLWRLRGLMDKMAGGYGLNRGRRAPDSLRVGDAIDFWKVVDIREDKLFMSLPAVGADEVVGVDAVGPLAVRQGFEFFPVDRLVTGDTDVFVSLPVIDPYQGSEISVHDTPLV